MPTRTERLLFYCLSFAIMVYAILRAKWIPVTIDEVSTVVNQINRSAWDIITYRVDASPNNHVLHTLLVNAISWLLGHHHVVVRIPALLGGALYTWAALKIAQKSPAFGWRLFTWLLLMGNPFVIEFFSLARGYSLGAGAMLAAIYWAIEYESHRNWQPLLRALLFGIVAVESNFTLLNFFAPFVVILAIAGWGSGSAREKALHWTMIGAATAALAALIYTPITAMRATDQFVFWGNAGFFKETLLELVRTGTRNSDFAGPETRFYIAWAVVLTALSGWAIAIGRWQKRKFRLDRGIVLCGLFAGTFITNMLQHYLFATPFLNARTALFYYPLWALQAAVLVQWWAEKNRWTAWLAAALLSGLVAINFYRCYNLSNAYEWWFDAGTFRAIAYMEERYQEENRSAPFTIDTNWPHFNSFMYHLQWSTPHYEEKIQIGKWHPARPYPRDTDFYYTDAQEEINALQDAYSVVMTVPGTGLRLLRKK